MNKTILAAALALCAVATAAVAQTPAPKKAAKPAAKPVYCAVMGDKIDDPAKASGGKSVYKGKTYYFCCGGCKPAFDKDPAKYAKAADARDKAASKPAAKPVKKS